MAAATAMARRNRDQMKILAGDWSDLFPASVETSAESLTFVKKLVAVGVSTIMYLRSSLPEDAFWEKNLDHLRLKLLNGKSGVKKGENLCRWIRSAMDAVEKQYLRELILAVTAEPMASEKTLEMYTFQFAYNGEDALVTLEAGRDGHDTNAEDDSDGKTKRLLFDTAAGDSKNKGNKQKALYQHTVALLSKLVEVTSKMDLLPEEAYLKIKLEYYEDRTPADYHPEGFQESDVRYTVSNDVESVDLPSVKTDFHEFSVKIKSSLITPPIQATPQTEPKLESNHSNCQDLLPDHRGQVVCPCGVDDKVPLMLECSLCGTMQHGECFLIFTETQIPSPGDHVCDTCDLALKNDDSEIKCTDFKLGKMRRSGRPVTNTCLYRRVLFYCTHKGRTHCQPEDIAGLLSCDEGLAEAIFEKLTDDKVVAMSTGKIDIALLSKTFAPKYLGRNFMDRLNVVSLVKATEKMQVAERKQKGSKRSSTQKRETPTKKRARLGGSVIRESPAV